MLISVVDCGPPASVYPQDALTYWAYLVMPDDVDTTVNTTYGSVMTYSCRQGYVNALYGRTSVELWCDWTAEWVNRDTYCECTSYVALHVFHIMVVGVFVWQVIFPVLDAATVLVGSFVVTFLFLITYALAK